MEVKLSLQLAGTKKLISALTEINSVLKQINRSMGTAATKIKNAASKLNDSVNTLKNSGNLTAKKTKLVNATDGTGGGKKAKNDLQSLIDGANNPLTRLKNFFKKKLSSMAFTESGNLTKFGKLAIITVVLFGAFKALKSVIDSVITALRAQANLYYASGGTDTQNRTARGIQEALNLSDEDMAGLVNKIPGKGRGLKAHAKAIRNMSDEQAAYYASNMGLEQLLPLRDLSKKEFDKAIAGEGVENSTRGNRRSMADFNEAIGELKRVLQEFLVSLKPILDALTGVIKLISTIIDALSALREWTDPISIAGKFTDWIKDSFGPDKKIADKQMKAADKMGQAADKINGAADKFTGKQGTHGGGDRAKNAVPSSAVWFDYQRTIGSQVKAMGAFEF